MNEPKTEFPQNSHEKEGSSFLARLKTKYENYESQLIEKAQSWKPGYKPEPGYEQYEGRKAVLEPGLKGMILAFGGNILTQADPNNPILLWLGGGAAMGGIAILTKAFVDAHIFSKYYKENEQ